MRIIRGHKSRDRGEIVDILARTGTYTCPTLPHYRYRAVQSACRQLQNLGLVSVSGRNPESVNLVVTTRFRLWRDDVAAGNTVLGVVKWAKAQRLAGEREGE